MAKYRQKKHCRNKEFIDLDSVSHGEKDKHRIIRVIRPWYSTNKKMKQQNPRCDGYSQLRSIKKMMKIYGEEINQNEMTENNIPTSCLTQC